MKVVMLDAPAELIEERRRKGLDRHDEMWEGVLHMVPSPSPWHQRFGTKLLGIIDPIAEKLGLVASYETDLHDRAAQGRDYRQPDLIVYRPEHVRDGRVESAEVVVEILSRDDESKDKLPFYAARGVKEAFLMDPNSRVVELYRLHDGKLLQVLAADGVFPSEILGLTFKAIDGPKLLVRWQGGEVTI
jgi:Uma2 family endonuclease